MFIRKDKQALIFKLLEPTRITAVIPTAKLINHNGHPLVAVPHRPNESKVLRNLGYEVPDPLPIYYDFPGGRKPFDAQVTTAAFASQNDRCFILNSMGMGKTITALWAWNYMTRIKQVKRALVVCPLSTMQNTWAKEAFMTFPDKQINVLYGSKERRLKLLAQPADLYIINTDGIEIIEEALSKRSDIDLIIIDELALYRTGGTNRWKAMDKVCNRHKIERKVWGLTGAPIPHAPTDAWAQCRLVNPTAPNVPKYFTKFRDMTMRQTSVHTWVPKDDAIDRVFEMMQPSIRFALDDCVDLPPEIRITRDVQLTDEQTKLYREMMNRFRTEYESGEILAVNAAVKAAKLLQISLGVAYDPSGGHVVIPSKHRMDVLKELITEAEGKVIVFVPLTGALHNVAAELSKYWTVAVIDGSVGKTERDRIFSDFQNRTDPHILVAHPATMSHGVTLTAATLTAWYGPTNSNDTYVQACARVRRPGQTRSTVIAHLVGSPIERKMFERLQGKQQMQNVLLDLFKEQEIEA